MKLAVTAKRLKSNMDDVESQEFGIDAEGEAVIIDILRNKMYKHKIRTLVQEYISNGRDATREIKSSDKVRVTIPTMLNPTFKVRDFGPGISPNRMAKVFIKYGSSTKRDSNTQTGGFGIGAKSAWSYTDSFMITTYIDGVQRSYIAHIGASNKGRLDFLGEQTTTEKNGTEIQIPVSPKDISSFKSAAQRCVYFWSDAEKPEFVGDSLLKTAKSETINNIQVIKTDDIPEMIANRWDKGIVITIDGIPYFADQSLLDKVKSLNLLTNVIKGSRLVLSIPNGVVEVAASREEISDSPLTLTNLEKVAADALAEIRKKITDNFKNVTNPAEYLTQFLKLKEYYNLDAHRVYGDFKMGEHGDIESDLFSKVDICRASNDGEGKLSKHNLNKGSGRSRWRSSKPYITQADYNNIYFTDGTETIIVVNFRLRELLKTASKVVLIQKTDADAGEFDKLVKALSVKNLGSVAYIKPARQSQAQLKIAKTKQQFTVHTFDYPRHKTTSLDDNKQTWFYIDLDAKFDVQTEARQIDDYLSSVGGKQRVCKLAKTVIVKVKGDANFKPLSEFTANFVPTDNEINALKVLRAKNTDIMYKLQKVQGIKNKFLVKMIEEYKEINKAKTTRVYISDTIKKLIGTPKEVVEFVKQDTELEALLNKDYSLLTNIHWNGKIENEIVHYINAK